MSRALDDLDPKFRQRVDAFLALTVEAGIPILITDTLRTSEEQVKLFQAGRSWTFRSKHLADAHGKAHAIDVCPYALWDSLGPDKLLWNITNPAWPKLGALGKGVGLGWGGDWAQRDFSHFEDKEYTP